MHACMHVCLAFLHRYFESQESNVQDFICKSLVQLYQHHAIIFSKYFLLLIHNMSLCFLWTA